VIFKTFNLLSLNEKKFITVILLFATLTSFLEILVFFFLKILLINFPDFQNNNISIYSFEINFYSLIILFFVVFLLRNFSYILTSFLKNKLVKSVNDRISGKIYKNYLNRNYYFFINKNSSELISNIIFEVEKFSYRVLDSFLAFVTEVFLVISILFFLFIIYSKYTLFLTGFILLFFVLFAKIFKSRFNRMGNEKIFFDKKKIEDLQKSFYTIQNIKLDNLENFFLKKFEVNTNESSKKQFLLQFILELPKPLIEIIVLLIFVLFLFISHFYAQVSKSEMILILGIFAIALFRILPSCNRIFNSVNSFNFYLSSVHLIDNELKDLAQNNETINSSTVSNDLIFRKSITLKNISYSYGSQSNLVLNNINLVIKKNTSVGIIGESGSGKTTLINIVCGLLTPSTGEILIDGLDIKNNYFYQKKIGYVPQRIYLTDESVVNNIIFGYEDNRFDKIFFEQVIRQSKLDDLINRLPFKEHTTIGERGIKLSGGEQQRIGIARALYKKPEILILDEATSSLDTNTEEKITETIDALKDKLTIIIISHKKTVFDHCDDIYELREKILNKVFKK
jgi:ABC-type branched-subunit amino acid transport system ATPase component